MILPEKEEEILPLLKDIAVFRKIYPKEHITLMLPKKYASKNSLKVDELIAYENLSEVFRKDYRFKLLFNFTSNKKIDKHYLNLSVLGSYSLSDLQRRASPEEKDVSKIFLQALTRKESIEIRS